MVPVDGHGQSKRALHPGSDPRCNNGPLGRTSWSAMTTIEVFADIACPFAHISLRRLTAHRAEAGRDDVRFRVRAWPLEIVNGEPMDPAFILEEVTELRPQVASDLFARFTASRFPASSLPALALEAAAHAADPVIGERVSLELRDRLFERDEDVADPAVLRAVAEANGVDHDPEDLSAPERDHREGVERGVVGSPHFFTPSGSFFCPVLDVGRDDEGHLVVAVDPDGVESFLAACFT